MHVEGASTNLECVAVTKVARKFALFEKKPYKILEPATFRTDSLVKEVFDAKNAEMKMQDFEAFCKLCSFVSPLVHTLIRYNDKEKQRYQVGLLPGTVDDPLALLASQDWLGAGWDYLEIHAHMRYTLEQCRSSAAQSQPSGSPRPQ